MRTRYLTFAMVVAAFGNFTQANADPPATPPVHCPAGYSLRDGQCVRNRDINGQSVDEPQTPSYDSDHPQIPVCEAGQILKHDKCVPKESPP